LLFLSPAFTTVHIPEMSISHIPGTETTPEESDESQTPDENRPLSHIPEREYYTFFTRFSHLGAGISRLASSRYLLVYRQVSHILSLS